MPTIDLPEDIINQCRLLLREGRLHCVLSLLNGRTRHRYTGMYRFDPPLLRNLSLYDRQNPGVTRGGDTPMRETYCSIVSANLRPFATDDAAATERLVSHPARTSVLAYCGVPVFDGDGHCFGSLCHYDMRPRLAPAAEVPVLEAVAELIRLQLNSLGLDSPPSQPVRRSHAREGRQIRIHNESDQRSRTLRGE